MVPCIKCGNVCVCLCICERERGRKRERSGRMFLSYKAAMIWGLCYSSLETLEHMYNTLSSQGLHHFLKRTIDWYKNMFNFFL